MSAIYDAHYEAMQADLRKCHFGRRRSTITVAEMRMAIAWRYRLQLPLADSTISPITYWRWHWPRFDSEVKYQELRYTLSCYPPKGPAAEIRATILEEQVRRLRHIEINPALFGYVESGRIDRDLELFARDQGTTHASSEWIAGLWAFDRYDRYLEARFPRFMPGYRPGGAAQAPLGDGDMM
jgi:hypothetical protein